MRFQLLSPVVSYINGDTLADALKTYVKINYAQQIRNLIVSDQINKYNADVKYYRENNKNKIGIKITPDVGYTIYPSNNFIKPIYRENTNGNSPDIVNYGLPVNQIISTNPMMVPINPMMGQFNPMMAQVNPMIGINQFNAPLNLFTP
jgi:hypothetical protein